MFFQYTANGGAKGYLSGGKRPCFASQKATFYKALEIRLLQKLHEHGGKTAGGIYARRVRLLRA